MVHSKSGSFSKEDTIQIALSAGIIDYDEICSSVEKMKREEILSNHPFSVWQNQEGIWMTYIPDPTKKNGRAFRKRKTYSGLRLLVRGIFKFGKSKGYTTLSMAEFFGDLELPNNIFEKKIINREDEIFLEDEIPIVTDYLRHHIDIWNMGLLLQLQTGMRVGELSALKPEDIHSDFIKVCRTEIKYRNEEGKWKVDVKEFAKTDAGNRELYFPDSFKWTLAQIQHLNPHGEYLFMNNGKRIRENTFNKRLSSICEELRINHRSTHKVRKTYGTTLLDNDVDDSVASEQMGHKDVSTTRKLYYLCNKNKKTKIAQIKKAINF